MKQKIKFLLDAKCLAGLVSAALLVPAAAIENPAGDDAPKPKESPKVAAAGEAPKAAEKPAEEPEQKTAMLGVGGMAASETLSLQLGLEKGNGLTLYHIVPGSSAEKAGLKQHDILTEFDGKKIGNQQDLRDAVEGKKPGDEVAVKYVSRGKAQEKKITLGVRKQVRGVAHGPGINPEWLRKNLGGNIPPAGIVPMNEEMMKQIQQQMQQLQQGQGGAMKLDIGKMLKGANAGAVNLGIGAAVTLMDNDGSITMKTNNGKKEVIVKDKAGKTLFEGPYQTEQDKAAVPEEIRERIEKLNMPEMKRGMNLRIMPQLNLPPGGALKDDAVEEEPAEEKPAEKKPAE